MFFIKKLFKARALSAAVVQCNSMAKCSILSPIARLHSCSIPTGFLSTLGTTFLSRLYAAIATAPQSVLFAALKDEQQEKGVRIEAIHRGQQIAKEELLGFVAGTIDTQRMYRHIVLHQGVLLAFLLLPALLRPASIRKIVETLCYGKKTDNDAAVQPEHESGPAAELLSIAVAPAARGMGVGKELVNCLGNWFSQNACVNTNAPAYYKVVTLATDERSNSFYGACGFVFVRKFRHHENMMNEYVMKNCCVNA